MNTADQLDNLFKFPVMMIDVEIEQRKEKKRSKYSDDDILSQVMENSDDDGVEIISGEAECPYYDFVSVVDRWIPTKYSRDKAKKGKFDNCFVVFGNSGSFVVPWPKDKFKQELKTFIGLRKVVEPEKEVIINIPREDMLRLLKEAEMEEEEGLDNDETNQQ